VLVFLIPSTVVISLKTHLAAIMAIPLIFTNPEMTEVQKLFSNKGNQHPSMDFDQTWYILSP
jgi:hypothetical protein